MKLLLCCLGLVLVFPAMAENAGPVAANWVASGQSGIQTETGTTALWTEDGFDDGSADALLRQAFEAAVSGAPRGTPADEMIWEPVIYGSGFTREVMISRVWDDGSGPALYAGGMLMTAGPHQALGVARWDGNEWTPLGLGLNGTVRAMAEYEGDLIVAGSFTQAANAPGDVIQVNNIARWDGQAWSPVGSGFQGPSPAAATVMTLTVYDGDLIAGGAWLPDAAQPTNWIARWDGSQWSDIGGGFNQVVWSVAVMNDELYAAGTFTQAGGQPANRVARWDGSQWHDVGGGMNSAVIRLTEFNGELYAGGPFTNAGGNFASRIARWNGSAWSAVGTGLIGTNTTNVRVMQVIGDELVVGGTFTHAGGQPSNHIARWNGTAWAPLAGPSGSGVSGMVGQLGGEQGAVSTVSEFQGRIIAGGMFYRAGGIRANYIAAWTPGDGWTPFVEAVNTGMVNYSDINNAPARALAQYGDDLIVAGGFDDVGGLANTGRIARWDGTQWHTMGNGVDVLNPALGQNVTSMTVMGGNVYIGGDFSSVSGVSGTRGVARWDGVQWQALGQGVTGAPPGLAVSVETLIDYEDDLIAGGTFLQASGVDTSGIARWDGGAWSGVGGGTNGTVSATAVFQGDLIIGGSFTQAGGVNVNYVARWDGSQWSSMGGGMNAGVLALTVHNGELIAGGHFTHAGGVGASRVARWDGTQWLPLAGGISGGSPRISELASYNGDLYATGLFNNADAGGQIITVNNIARWDGTRWWPLAGPMGNGLTGQPSNPWAFSLGVYNPPGSAPARLVVGGFHLLTGGVPSWGLGFWGPATLDVSPPALDFGAVQSGDTGGPLTISLTSNAGANLTVSQIDSPHAAIVPDTGNCGPLPITLAPGGNCELAVVFQPTTAGPVSGILSIVSDAPTSPHRIHVQGVGSSGALALLPGTLDFGHLAVGGAESLPVTLINAEPGAISVTNVDVPAGPFVQVGGSCGNTPFNLASQAACTLLFEYAPVDAGSDAVQVTLTHNGAGGAQSLDLTGQAHQRELSVGPGVLDFGTVGLGQSVPEQILSLHNPAAIPTTISLLESPNAPFAVTASDCGTAPFTLPPGGDCSIAISFNPGSVGSFSDMLGIDGDGLAGLVEIVLQGTGTGARLLLDPPALTLGLQPDTTGSAGVDLFNLGDVALDWQVTQATQSGGLLLRSRGLASPPATAPLTAPVSGIEHAPAQAHGLRAYVPAGSGNGTSITHSESMDIASGHSIACSLGGTTADNSFLRVFDLDDFGLTEGFNVTEVTFGIEVLTGMVPLTINLYTLEGAFLYENLTPIGTATQLIPAQQMAYVSLPVGGSVPPRSVLVVELVAPSMAGLAGFWPGTNFEGETAPTYWVSDACDVVQPTPFATAGYPGVHMVMAVSGQAPANCVLPPWVAAGTQSGIIPAGEDQMLEITFNTAGMTTGTYQANLCLESNDGIAPVTALPLILNVAEDLLFRDRFE